jgi:hypothetical protein
VDTIKDNVAYAHPLTADTIEVHYSGLERLRPNGCCDGLDYIGYLAVDLETGDEVEIVDAVGNVYREHPQRMGDHGDSRDVLHRRALRGCRGLCRERPEVSRRPNTSRVCILRVPRRGCAGRGNS